MRSDGKTTAGERFSGRVRKFSPVEGGVLGGIRLEELWLWGDYHLRAIAWETGAIVHWIRYHGVPESPLLRNKGRAQILATWLKKVVPTLNGKLKPKTAACKWLAERAGALCELLTVTELDGKPRQTSSLTVYCEGSAWKGLVKDRETSCVLWATSDSFLGLLEALEAMLESGSAEWREDRWQGQQQKKRPS
jgi:hypothetical protein